MDGTVLVADDDRTIRTVLTQALTRAGCKVHATSSLVTLMRWVDEGKGDLVISDVVMPDGNGLKTLPEIGARRPGLPVIIISAQNTITTAIKAAEAEAYDYLPKPFDLPDLMKRAARALAVKRRLPRPRESAVAPTDELPLIGRTTRMQALYRLVARVVNADLPVLVLGASGTGKSLIARVIHDFSDRRDRPLVVASAAELEGADGPTRVLTRAGAGSIILDEVADLTPEAQGRLVAVLDKLDDSGPRIIATSQQDLAQRAAAGRFRDDLFYRLSGVTIEVPDLRDRIDDIPLLVQGFLDQSLGDGTAAHSFSAPALALLCRYSWPGNVRQLENLVRRLVLTHPNSEIGETAVDEILGAQPEGETLHDSHDVERLAAVVERQLQRYFDLHGAALPPSGLYQRILREIERPLIEISLAATGGNQAKCAQLLGINRNTLRKKISDLDIHVTHRRKLM